MTILAAAILALTTPGGPDYQQIAREETAWITPAPAPVVNIDGEWVPYAWDLYDWGRLAHCESRNRWHLTDGGVQIIPSTWRAYGGLEYAPKAGGASVAEQIIVARRIYDARGEQPWTCRW